jgi:regulator of extracellular matrix RemA (YlzA/DUF370 family)
VKIVPIINIGFNNMIVSERIVAITSPESAPIKRIAKQAKLDGSLIDATCGRKTKTIVVMDSGHIILSALTPETIGNRIKENQEA